VWTKNFLDPNISLSLSACLYAAKRCAYSPPVRPPSLKLDLCYAASATTADNALTHPVV